MCVFFCQVKPTETHRVHTRTRICTLHTYRLRTTRISSASTGTTRKEKTTKIIITKKKKSEVSRQWRSGIGSRAASSVCLWGHRWTDRSAGPSWQPDGTCCAGCPTGRSIASRPVTYRWATTWARPRPATCATARRNRCRRTTAVCARTCASLEHPKGALSPVNTLTDTEDYYQICKACLN